MDTPQNAPEPVVTIESVDQFAAYFIHWHSNRRAQLQQVLNAPDDMEILFKDGENGEETPLTAEDRRGFRAGITVAIDILGKLPFVVTPEFEDPGNDLDLPQAKEQELRHE